MQEAQLADVKWHQAVFEVLLSYHPFWLRLGLETVVGQLLPANTGDFFRHVHAGSILFSKYCYSLHQLGAVVFDPEFRNLATVCITHSCCHE